MKKKETVEVFATSNDIEINLERTPNSNFYDLSINGKSGEILPQIFGKEQISN